MARQSRGLFVSIFKDFINSLKPRSFKGVLVGEDYNGNKYYEIPSDRKRPARYFVAADRKEESFEVERLPVEWEAWLRYRRKAPPTNEEIESNLAEMYMRIENAKKIDEKFKTKQIEGRTAYEKNYPKYDDLEVYPGKKPGNRLD
ncbi:hypothetical protein O3M35_006798 [Rhynocoris fuscipes]|uniref:NADH dehydrogenase [ubiquinone] 1 alpha subcomplex assembly factor 2 n=1 Tax=Rhynocoris fuscipes TaxID=488301 RepID=A0AAW1DMD4_9HEMI